MRMKGVEKVFRTVGMEERLEVSFLTHIKENVNAESSLSTAVCPYLSQLCSSR